MRLEVTFAGLEGRYTFYTERFASSLDFLRFVTSARCDETGLRFDTCGPNGDEPRMVDIALNAFPIVEVGVDHD